MNFDDFQRLKQILSKPKKICIVTHRNPDGDAYGSSLALYLYLLKFDHEVTVLSPNDCPEFLKWLPKEDEIVIFENDSNKGTKIIENSDIIFTLDFNALHRVGERMLKSINKVNPIFVMIDHHQEPEDYASFKYVNPEISSTSQMIYQFIEKMDHLECIDIDIATCLYTGILTDTGSFRFPSTDSETHKVVAHLMEIGANNSEIYNNIHDVNTYDRMQLLSIALQNMVVVKEFHTAYITLSQNELNKFNFKKGDTEGFVNYALSIKNIFFAAIFIEDKKQGIVKISFRSVGNFSVNEFSRNSFEGGGHINAAGGKSNLTLKKTVSKFLEILPRYKDQLKQLS